MTREEKINIAASKYIEDNSVRGAVCISNHKDSFIEGADWADEHPKEGLVNLSQVWHDADEEPEALKQVVAIDKKGVSFSGKYWPREDKEYNVRYSGVYWNGDGCLTGARLLDWQKVVKWAYIDDLMPSKKEIVMTRKEHQEECFISFVQEEYPSSVLDNIEFINSLRDAFNAGIDCANILPKSGVTKLTKIWHDAKKEPEKDKLMIGIDEDGVSIYKWVGQNDDDWLSFAEDNGLFRWAYINDLLPKNVSDKSSY